MPSRARKRLIPATIHGTRRASHAIKDEARRVAGSLAIDDSAGQTEAGFFGVTILAADRPPTSTIGAEYPGGPNQRVAVRVTYNHDLITPFLREVYPWLRLTARSEMINERFRHPGYGKPPGVLPPEIPLIISGYVSTADSQDLAGCHHCGFAAQSHFTNAHGLLH